MAGYSNAHRKWLNELRFLWHEAVIADERMARRSVVLRLAGYIMHKFHIDLGYVQFSAGSAAKSLGIDKRQLKRAKRYLEEHGWLKRRNHGKATFGWQAECYELGGGPNKIDFQARRGKPKISVPEG